MMQTVEQELRHRRTILLICRNCFWCASSFNSYRRSKCPLCHRSEIKSIPVCDNESHRFEYDPTGGMVIEFTIDLGNGTGEV